MRIKLLLVFVASFGLVWLGSPVAMALDKPEFGGNNASDYQPVTRNPQPETLGSLQPTNPHSLQPTNSGVNPQDVTQTGGLTVAPSTDKGANNTSSEQPVAKKPGNTRVGWVIGSLAALTAIAYLIIKPETKPKQPEIVELPPAPVSQNLKKTKKPNKKSSSKKRKPARR